MSTTVRIMRLPPLPAYQSAHAAGLDLVAALPVDYPVIIAPGGRAGSLLPARRAHFPPGPFPICLDNF
jgi:dUTP diphosphatase